MYGNVRPSCPPAGDVGEEQQGGVWRQRAQQTARPHRRPLLRPIVRLDLLVMDYKKSIIIFLILPETFQNYIYGKIKQMLFLFVIKMVVYI